MRSVVGLALLLGAASGFQAVAPALRPLASSATPICRTAAAPTMRHNLYFQRLARADAGRLRLCVYRSNNHIYAQVVDDREGKIVASASTIEKDHKKAYGGNVAAAKDVGERVAKRAVEKGVEKVHFDRNGKKYHGRIAALADAARENGLSF